MAERKCVTDSANTAQVAAPRAPTNAWLVLALLLAIYIFNFADRYLITGLVGPIKAEFGLGDDFMGLLMGPAFVALYVFAGVPIARLADRKSRIAIIAAGCVVWSAATVATGMATGPVSLALSRVAVGIGEAAFIAPAYSLLADYFPVEKRGRAFAILGLATYFGQIAGQAGGPWLAAIYDWRTAFFMMGAPGLILGLLAVLTIREPVRTVPVKAVPAIPFGTMLGTLRRAPSYVLMMFGMGLGSLSGVAFGYWGPELFTRSYGIDPTVAKTAFAVNFGGAGLLGMLLFGTLSDKLTRRGRDWPIRLTAAAMGSATACILMVTWADNFALATALAIPCGLLGGGWAVGVMSSLQYILPERFRATATASFIMVTTLLGYFVGPWLTGSVSQALGGDAWSLRMGLSVAIPLGFIGALCCWLAARTLERDRAALSDA